MIFLRYNYYDCEPKSDLPSVTEHCEPMSIKQLLERAERGIVDLSVLSKSSMEDYKDDSKLNDDSFNDFSSGDNFFGSAVEDTCEDLENMVARAKLEKSSSPSERTREESEPSDDKDAHADAE